MVVSAKFNIKTRVHYFGVRQAAESARRLMDFSPGDESAVFQPAAMTSRAKGDATPEEMEVLGGEVGFWVSAHIASWGEGTSREEGNSETRTVHTSLSILRLFFFF